jgi:hypothetical protein
LKVLWKLESLETLLRKMLSGCGVNCSYYACCFFLASYGSCKRSWSLCSQSSDCRSKLFSLLIRDVSCFGV